MKKIVVALIALVALTGLAGFIKVAADKRSN